MAISWQRFTEHFSRTILLRDCHGPAALAMTRLGDGLPRRLRLLAMTPLGQALPYTDVIARPRRGRGNPYPVQAVLPRCAAASTRAGGKGSASRKMTASRETDCRVGTKPLPCTSFVQRQVPAQPLRSLDSATGGAPLRPTSASPPRNDAFGSAHKSFQLSGEAGHLNSSFFIFNSSFFILRFPHYTSSLYFCQTRCNFPRHPV